MAALSKDPHDSHPVRDSLLRLLLILVWYGAIYLIGFAALLFTVIIAGSVGDRIAAVLGGARLAKVAGFIVMFALLMSIQVGVGLAIGFASAEIKQRWPNNAAERLVRWVRAIPPSSYDDGED